MVAEGFALCCTNPMSAHWVIWIPGPVGFVVWKSCCGVAFHWKTGLGEVVSRMSPVKVLASPFCPHIRKIRFTAGSVRPPPEGGSLVATADQARSFTGATFQALSW